MAVRGDKDAGFALASSPSHLLQRAQQVAADHFSLRLSGTGLTVRQFALLCSIETFPGSTQTELVNGTGIDRSTLADLMHRMQDRGLITRNRATGDARANSVTLTPAGLALLREAIPRARAADAALLALLPKRKRQALISALQQVGAIGTEREPAPLKDAKKAKFKSKKPKSDEKSDKPKLKKKLKKGKKKQPELEAEMPVPPARAKRKIDPPAN